MKKTLFLAAAALFIFASCQKEEVAVNNQNADLVFTATISSDDTKTTTNAATGKVSWVSGDTITVTDAAKTSAKYTVSSIDTKGKATFTKVDGQPALGDGPYKAVYGTDPAAVQTYSTTAPSLPMSAESENTSLTFTVSCGLLELTVTAFDTIQVKNVSKIEVRGTPAGKDTTVYYTLKCDTPIDISTSKVFYIALPAGTYSKVYVTNDTYLCDTTRTSSVTIAANTIQPKTVSNVKFRYVKDIEFNVYSIVTINNVTWMADNLACEKYDTDSEVYTDDPDNYFRDHNYIIPKPQPSTPTFKDTARTPYYTDATDRTTWSQRTAAKKQQTALSDAQVAKMGYLYNWAAAVGVATDLLRTTDFTGRRQGICPNGWHVPSQAELDALKTFIEGKQGTDTGGHHLKSSSGWYDAGNPTKYPQGADTYGFNLLPAGFSAGDSISNVGAAGHVLTASPSASRDTKFYYGYGSYTNKQLPTSDGAPKCNGRSLRCIKNK